MIGASGNTPLERVALPRLGRCFAEILNHIFKKKKKEKQNTLQPGEGQVQHPLLRVWLGLGTSQVSQMVKCLPAMWGTRVQSLGQEDPLEKEMATHSSTVAWTIPWTEEPGRLQSMGPQRVGHD